MFLYSLHLQFYVHIQFFSPPKTYFSARIYCFFSICWAFVFHLLSLAKITICLVLFYIFVSFYHLIFSYFAIKNVFNSQKTNFQNSPEMNSFKQTTSQNWRMNVERYVYAQHTSNIGFFVNSIVNTIDP